MSQVFYTQISDVLVGRTQVSARFGGAHAGAPLQKILQIY